MNIILNTFGQWEIITFTIILLVGAFLHLKYNWFKFLNLTPEEKETNSNRINFVVIVFLISFLIYLLYDSIKIIFEGVDSTFKIAVWMVLLIAYLILMIISFANIESTNRNKKIFIFAWFLFLVFFLSKNMQTFYGDIATIVLGLSAIISPFLIKKDWKKVNFYPYITLLVMLFVFWGGLLFVDSMYGNQNKNIDLLLNIDGNTQNRYFEDGKIICSNPYTDIYVNSTVNCEVFPNSKINSANVTFISAIGNIEKIPLENMTFTFPYEVSRIIFEMNLTKENQTYYVTTSNNYKNIFTFYEDSLERDKNFILYVFILLGLVFFSIPPMVEKFSDIIKKN